MEYPQISDTTLWVQEGERVDYLLNVSHDYHHSGESTTSVLLLHTSAWIFNAWDELDRVCCL
jgi:hypothetical protein